MPGTSTFAVLFVFVDIWHQVARRTHSLLSPRLAMLAEDALEPNVSFDRPVGRMSSSSGLPFTLLVSIRNLLPPATSFARRSQRPSDPSGWLPYQCRLLV